MTVKSKTAKRLYRKWDLDWDILDVLIGGRSAIDLEVLNLNSFEEATDFLRKYGYEPDRPKDAREIHAVIVESWHFIAHVLMPREWRKGMKPPDDLLFADDVRPLLLAASQTDPSQAARHLWACALLRVMHTICHIDGVHRTENIKVARNQILQRFHDLVFHDEKGDLRFGRGRNSVVLKSVEWKNEKTRQSIILKLLHKKANVAETIYDLLGVRLVTKRLSDVLLVVKYLSEYHVISFPNCNPARARNTLIDVEQFQQELEVLRVALGEGTIDHKEFLKQVRKDTYRVAAEEAQAQNSNPHSGVGYRSIQLTCRQLIRYPNPLFGFFGKLRQLTQSPEISPVERRALADTINFGEKWHGFAEFEVLTSFFPFEIQIVDSKTATQNKSGDAAHDRYKRAQIKSARRRVLSGVLTHYINVKNKNKNVNVIKNVTASHQA